MRTNEPVSREGLEELLQRSQGKNAKTMSEIEDFVDICFCDDNIATIEVVLTRLFHRINQHR